MSDSIQSPFSGAVHKDPKTKCTGDGQGTGSNASGGSSSKSMSY